ncbi:serine/threonine-protein kinase pim-2-like isoform X2 [Gouania willdenowi]|uniref:serine/threonine-protein kinase pim-2-like isoform X2 n=1 Tax=Gouania willdenowi TaxID=441366 RepID=UPI00105648E2|nr:serine/threonine-protein kinase pim-2-like isoform X2 [Gouania willdenowi]
MDFLIEIPRHVQNLTKEGPIPRHFEAPLKDEDRLLTTGRGQKRKADEDNVLLSNSKKPKVVEGFQELKPNTTLKARRTVSLSATTKESQICNANRDGSLQSVVNEYVKSFAPTIPTHSPLLEDYSQVYPASGESPAPDSPCLDETDKDWFRKRGPIPRHFEAPLKDEDGLLTTGRGQKRKAEEDNVLLSNSKKPKVVEGFQEPKPNTTLKARRTVSLSSTKESQICDKCKDANRDDSLQSVVNEYVKTFAPTIPTHSPLLEDYSQFFPAPEESPAPDSPGLDETEKDWIQKREDFEDSFKEQCLLGEGGFGSVYAGINLLDNKSVALKHIPKEKVKYWQVDNGELKVLEALLLMKAAGNLGERCKYNPGIIELVDIVELEDEVVIVMELPDNAMDLHNYSKMKNGEMQEQEVKVIIQQILKAAFIMHKNGVFHRDIKAENILISNTNGTPSVKIIDFGCGDWVKDVPYEQFAGTLIFAPPEFLHHNKYQAEQTTVWQIGLLLRNLYTQKPYSTKEHMKGETLIINRLSVSGNTFAMQCLTQDPTLRVGLEKLLEHAWFKV